MNDAEIAPLAQRLAEENNVDWRRLRGSGANGRIVERDVLEYLARVMAGEESLDPTPEPLPEGLDAWPEEDGGVRHGAGHGGAPAPATGGNGVAPPDAAGGSPRGTDDGGVLQADDEDDLLLAGDDAWDEGTGDDEEALRLASEREPGTVAPRDLPDLFDDEEPPARERGRGDAPALFDGDADWEGGADAAPATGEGDRDAGRSVADLGGSDGGADDDTFDFGGFPGRDEVRGADTGAGDLDAVASGDDDWRFDDPVSDEPDRAPNPAEDVRMDGPGEGDEATLGTASPTASASSVEGAGVGPLPVARSRQVLRRQVDLGNALALQRLVSSEASAGDDVALTALLLLAARREGAVLQISRPGVAIVTDAGRVAGATVAGTSLGEVATRLTQGERSEDGDVDLFVVDLSGYGLDDAVLDVDVPQLTLGRILSDGDDGGVRATLALAGEVPLDRGATFLARVAGLVEEPLRLLV